MIDLEKLREMQSIIERRCVAIWRVKSQVELCKSCQGIGSYTKEEMVDYHRNDYATIRYTCKTCDGDGRIVTTTRSLEFDGPHPITESIPYTKFVGDPHASERTDYSVRIDLNNYRLNAKYPDLAALAYEHYDEMVQQYQTLDALKKEHK